MQATLVLTDVQGSTELWEWDEGVMNDAQSLHDRIIRSRITEFFGYEACSAPACPWVLCLSLSRSPCGV